MGRVMKRSDRSPKQSRAKWYAMATGLVRPGAEAVLLAGVAFGCAQIGWRIVQPQPAGATAAPALTDGAASDVMSSFQSPFSPTNRTAASAVPEVIAAIHLVGVRMSEQQSASGAVLTFGDGLQRPFLVGYEIGAGVRLTEVHSDHIVVSFADDEQIIPLERATNPTQSFALALMGLGSQPSVAPAGTSVAAASGPVVQSVSLPGSARSPAGAQWLLSTMGSVVETRDGAPYAWRVSSAPPAVLGERGLATGDLILSINGARPGDAAAVMAAARSSWVELAIERTSGERTTIVLANGFAS